MNPTERDEPLLKVEPHGSNFVSNQALTCQLETHIEGDSAWSFSRTSTHMVAAGMPRGQHAVSQYEQWCAQHSKRPLIFACEPQDLAALEGWKLVELGRQPVFRTGRCFRPELSGNTQPVGNREMRRQARRASSKDVDIVEIRQGELWELEVTGGLDELLNKRQRRQLLPEFGFLVGLHLGTGGAVRRYFLARRQDTGAAVGLAITVESGRGYLLEHQLLCRSAPNGTGELLLCEILASFLPPGRLLSLGITPLYRSLVPDPSEVHQIPSILSFLKPQWATLLLRSWEPLYGFRSLLSFRRKLEPDQWEPVYWAHRGSHLLALLAVLQAFARGSLWRFGWEAVEKWWHQLCRGFSKTSLWRINAFFVASLMIWIPVLWHLDGTKLFGFPEAAKVWACYDVCLLMGFWAHGRAIRRGHRRTGLGQVLLGLVLADAIFSWIQTAFVHTGLPANSFLGLFLFLINSAPLAAATFLMVCRGARRPSRFPLPRRDVARA